MCLGSPQECRLFWLITVEFSKACVLRAFKDCLCAGTQGLWVPSEYGVKCTMAAYTYAAVPVSEQGLRLPS